MSQERDKGKGDAADTPLERVDVLDYDVTTGAVSGRRAFADLREVPGRPDGLTVDADGGVWIPAWPARRVSPSLTLIAGRCVLL